MPKLLVITNNYSMNPCPAGPPWFECGFHLFCALVAANLGLKCFFERGELAVFWPKNCVLIPPPVLSISGWRDSKRGSL